ncbi:MAG: menaquinone biosynthesis protein [Tepidisphaeraceae bacterium]
MDPAVAQAPAGRVRPVLHVGSVSYLNAKPLIYGLEDDPRLQLDLEVPARLLEGLRTRRYDLALLPVIDYQRHAGLKLVPAGGIGCDGPTLTVRIFSAEPIEKIQTLACDRDSHTSTVLAQILLAERWGLKPKLVDLAAADAAAHTAVLLIGDKVVRRQPPDKPRHIDLGALWKELTGMPFVFAVWTTRAEVDLGDLPQRLERAKRLALAHVDAIVRQHAAALGWPVDLARQYLGELLKYDIGPSQLQAIRRFHELAFKHGLIDQLRPLQIY